MSRRFFIIANEDVRTRAIIALDTAPTGSRVEIKGPQRTNDQNARLWAMLTEIAEQVDWYGQHLSSDDWKHVFLAALKQELRVVPNLDGNGFVQLGRSSSDLSKAEFSDLFEVIHAFAASKGVVFHSNMEVA
jgi:hypothetical protein